VVEMEDPESPVARACMCEEHARSFGEQGYVRVGDCPDDADDSAV
jgi:hypothetical protein